MFTKEIINLTTAAEMINVSRVTLYNWLRVPEIKKVLRPVDFQFSNRKHKAFNRKVIAIWAKHLSKSEGKKARSLTPFILMRIESELKKVVK